MYNDDRMCQAWVAATLLEFIKTFAYDPQAQRDRDNAMKLLKVYLERVGQTIQ